MKLLSTLILPLILISCKTEVSDSNSKFKSLNSSTQGASAAFQEAQAIIARSCYECHAGGARNYADQTEESWKSHADIIAGNAEASPLYDSVVNKRMPLGKPALSTSELETIQTWINEMGAEEGFQRGEGVAPPVADTSPAFVEAYNVLYKNCVPCHAAQNSNNVTSFEMNNQLAWAYSGLIVSQDSGASLLYQRILDGTMPPDPLRKLSNGDREKIRNWIDGFSFSVDNGGSTGNPGGGNNPPNAAQRLADAKTLLQGRCNGCHTNGGNSGGFSFGNLLNAGASYQDWDNAQVNGMDLFAPGNPNGSRIFIVLRNSGQQPADMPTNANNAFNNNEISTLRNWIMMANQP